ncbi:MAG: hypothetical protein AB7Q29_17295 [Vicinamibacterales bacterium]
MSGLGILFWHYTDAPLCASRVQALRHHNPGVPIWGLYGGDTDRAATFERMLSPLLDDFYVYDEERSPRWKWEYGDQIVLKWFAERGRLLSFDSVVLAQWDLAAFASMASLFRELPAGHVCLPGLRPIREVEAWWDRADAGHPENRSEYLAFLDMLRSAYGYAAEPMCCEFTIGVLPKAFLAAWSDACLPQRGWLEYRIPMYAQLLGFPLWCGPSLRRPFVQELRKLAPLRRWWVRTLTAGKTPVANTTIAAHLFWPGGDRLFHPVRDVLPVTRAGVPRWFIGRLQQRYGGVP